MCTRMEAYEVITFGSLTQVLLETLGAEGMNARLKRQACLFCYFPLV